MFPLSVDKIVSLSPSNTVQEVYISFHDLENELLGPSFEVSSSLSVCGNIHQVEANQVSWLKKTRNRNIIIQKSANLDFG